MTAPGSGAPPPLRGARLYLLWAAAALFLVGCGILLAGPALYRSGLADIGFAMRGLSRASMWIFSAGGVVALGALLANLVSPPRRGAAPAVALALVCLIGVLRLQAFDLERASLPPLHDVQTDWTQPVSFTVRALDVREAAGAAPIRDDAVFPEEAGAWAGRSFADAQSEVYDLNPVRVGAPPPEATLAVAEAAERLGWAVMLNDPPGGQVEAVHYSRWYGLPSDIAVRISPDETGSRIDVRAASRQAGSDMGANASLIKSLIDEVSFALRGRGEPESSPAS
jgi:hypothetical protein